VVRGGWKEGNEGRSRREGGGETRSRRKDKCRGLRGHEYDEKGGQKEGGRRYGERKGDRREAMRREGREGALDNEGKKDEGEGVG